MAYKNNLAAAGRSNAPDVFVSGVECVEAIGGNLLRVVYYVTRIIEGVQVRAPAPINLIIAADACPDAIGKVTSAIGRKMSIREDGLLVVCH